MRTIICSLQEAEEFLKQYVVNARQYISDGLTLDRMWPMLEAVGNPHEKLKVIHVAGTSGKTSTAYYIAGLLHSADKKVGLTVSPHIDSLTERLQINGAPITDKLFCAELSIFLDIIENSKTIQRPSYFELLIVFILWEFARQKVDYAVLETGLGGLLDSTNVARLTDKVCVITDIGMDHMNILGNTITAIAAQKVGIVHKNNHVFLHRQPEEVMKIINQARDDKQARIHVVNTNTSINAALIENNAQLALYQQRNFQLANEAVIYIARRDKLLINQSFDPSTITVPARMEVKKLADDTLLIMDGAHNHQKTKAFVQSFQEKYPHEKAVILLAVKTGKEYKDVIDALKPITSSILVTTFSMSQDTPIYCLDPDVIVGYAKSIGIDAIAVEDMQSAYGLLIATDVRIKLVTGSFYLIGQVRTLL
jgi:dihydrofolate synthase/folylpolyglutamate synthase